MRDDGGTGPLTRGSGRMGSKDPVVTSGCMAYITLSRQGSGSARVRVHPRELPSGSEPALENNRSQRSQAVIFGAHVIVYRNDAEADRANQPSPLAPPPGPAS